MTRRFSPEELYFLRNRVPIAQVVETLLGPASQNSNGKLSFACPICGGSDTSIIAAHNLAKCFTCRQKFNPIEFVMHRLKIDFVDSVKWLKDLMPATPAHPNTHTAESNNAHPSAIGDVLSDILPKLSKNQFDAQSLESIIQRISRLEQHFKDLSCAVSMLQSSLHQ